MVWLVWLELDDIDSMIVGVATDENKANKMKNKLEETDVFEGRTYNIVPFKIDTLTINNVDYKF